MLHTNPISLGEEDLVILLYMRQVCTSTNPGVPILRIHEDLEENYGWECSQFKECFQRLMILDLVAVEGSLKEKLALTHLGFEVANRI